MTVVIPDAPLRASRRPHPEEPRSQRRSCAAKRGVSKDGCAFMRCVHPSRRIAEPVIGRAFARPLGKLLQDEVFDPHGEEEVLDPHGEERGKAARLEPRGPLDG